MLTKLLIIFIALLVFLPEIYLIYASGRYSYRWIRWKTGKGERPKTTRQLLREGEKAKAEVASLTIRRDELIREKASCRQDLMNSHSPLCSAGYTRVGAPGCVCTVISKGVLLELAKKYPELQGYVKSPYDNQELGPYLNPTFNKEFNNG